ncbi:hypothetical protein LCGC14_1929220 [marine sediment metagenome]|uniref:SCP domain-containing protein n=1 Tax=marine sediment metagenome TaxID=412755 RepID=A0A0F9IL85_9ZZZZ
MVALIAVLLGLLRALVALVALVPSPRAAPAPTPVATPAPTPVSAPSLAEHEIALVDALNAERQAAGLEALTISADLIAVARTRSRDMMTGGYFAHYAEGHPSAYELLTDRGMRFTAAGEVLARVASREDSAERAVTALMQSSTHRDRILDPLYQLIGVGAITAQSGQTIYTVLFLTPAGG